MKKCENCGNTSCKAWICLSDLLGMFACSEKCAKEWNKKFIKKYNLSIGEIEKQNKKHEAIEIPKENLKVTFNEIMRYLSERIDNEIRLQILGKTLTPHGEKKQKHEEIKRMAFDFFNDIYISALKNGEAASQENIRIFLKGAWERAEEFYHYAKEKQEGNL